MQLLALVAIFYFFFGACVCLLICVNPNDPGVLGSSRRVVFQKLPSAFSAFVRRVFGERVLGYLGRVKHYLMQTNHPIVQWFYYLIAVGGFIGYTIMGIFRHMPNDIITDAHIIIAYVMAGFCFFVYYKACAVSPGEVTQTSSKQYVDRFKPYYNSILYKKDNKCTTCNVVKPARSKHCNVCRMCVSKFDHHCIWIRQCVGQKNYKYFVSFLFLHSIWCLYLSIIGFTSIYQHLVKMNFWNLSFRMGNQIVKGDNLLALQYIFVTETFFFFINVMCAIMGVTLFIFVSYHFYLIAQGQTTNERVKKNDYISHLKKQKKSIDKYMKQNPELPQQITFKNEKLKKKQFLQYMEDTNYRLSVLEKKMANPGFFANLKQIFSQPDK